MEIERDTQISNIESVLRIHRKSGFITFDQRFDEYVATRMVSHFRHGGVFNKYERFSHSKIRKTLGKIERSFDELPEVVRDSIMGALRSDGQFKSMPISMKSALDGARDKFGSGNPTRIDSDVYKAIDAVMWATRLYQPKKFSTSEGRPKQFNDTGTDQSKYISDCMDKLGVENKSVISSYNTWSRLRDKNANR